MKKKKIFGIGLGGLTLAIVFLSVIALEFLTNENVEGSYPNNVKWDMNEGQGTVAYDAIGSRDLYFSTENPDHCRPGWIDEGDDREGLLFSGPNPNKGYHLHSSEEDFGFTTSFEIFACIKLSSDRPHYGTICSKFSVSGNNYYGYFLGIAGDQLRLGVADGTGTMQTVYTNPQNLVNNQWIVVKAYCTLFGGYARLDIMWNIEGQPLSAQGTHYIYDGNWQPAASSNPFHVGQCCFDWTNNGGYRAFEGRMDWLQMSWQTSV